MKQRHLSELLGQRCTPDPLITGISLHSDLVGPGHLFAAFPGNIADGRQYIDQAIKNGAVAVLAPTGTTIINPDVTLVTDGNPRHLFSQIAARFYNQQPQTIAAVTGTNGKTSIVQFTRELWAMSGLRAASLGTIGLIAPHITRESANTTADTASLHRDLYMLAENNITHLALEASSHGLHQHRLDGLKIAVAGFTNLTRDHLDYHPTVEHYMAAKLRLFTELLVPGGFAVLNADIPQYADMRSQIMEAGRQVLSYGYQGEHLKIVDRRLLSDGQILTLNAFGQLHEVALPLIGEFQAMNVLCAAGMLITTGFPIDQTLDNLIRLSTVRGRLELAGTHPCGAPVYVDYAHTPDGLQTVLKALRPHTEKKLHVVFGCGGSRDAGKRPIMGQIANDLADNVIVTDDNPRAEDPAAIRAAIMAAAPTAQNIDDRAQAIETAIKSLQTGDVLVIAGKGHEQGQKIGTETYPFDDVSVARFVLASIASQPEVA